MTACDRAEAVFRDRCTGVAWELDTAHAYALWALSHLGHWAELTRRLPVLLGEARERGDLYAVMNLSTYILAVVRLAADEPDAARDETGRAMGHWSRAGYHVQHNDQVWATLLIDLYQSEGGSAWDRINRHWPILARSLLLRVQFIRVAMLGLRSRCALAAASSVTGEHPRAVYLPRRAATPLACPANVWPGPTPRPSPREPGSRRSAGIATRPSRTSAPPRNGSGTVTWPSAPLSPTSGSAPCSAATRAAPSLNGPTPGFTPRPSDAPTGSPTCSRPGSEAREVEGTVEPERLRNQSSPGKCGTDAIAEVLGFSKAGGGKPLPACNQRGCGRSTRRISGSRQSEPGSAAGLHTSQLADDPFVSGNGERGHQAENRLTRARNASIVAAGTSGKSCQRYALNAASPTRSKKRKE